MFGGPRVHQESPCLVDWMYAVANVRLANVLDGVIKFFAPAKRPSRLDKDIAYFAISVIVYEPYHAVQHITHRGGLHDWKYRDDTSNIKSIINRAGCPRLEIESLSQKF